MIQPLFDQQDDDWVWMVGRYTLNMGEVEAATRLIVVQIADTDAAPIFADGLSARIGFIRKRFPREPAPRHERVMNTLEVAAKRARFRNIVAHSPH
jgi:hypothetical protein